MRCTAYVRVSSDSSDQANSFENQQTFFKREFENRGHEFIRLYADKGLTGTQLYNREDFNNLMYDCGLDLYDKPIDPNDKRKNKRVQLFVISERQSIWDRIYVTNTSRWSRNTLNFDIIQKLRQKGVGIYFIQQNIDTADVNQDMLLKIIQIMDENESKDKSAKVKAGQAEGEKQGIIHSNKKLFGYKYHPRDLVNKIPPYLERIPKECIIVRFIHYKYDQGFGFRRIEKLLKEKGYKTRFGKDFKKSTIHAILIQSKYAGLDNRNWHDTGEVFNKNTYPKVKTDYLSKVKPSDKIPRIIHPNLFYRNQERLKSKVNYQNQRGLFTGTSEYAGILKCKNCGAIYHKNTDNGREFYNCSGKRANGIEYCNNPNISKRKVDQYFDELTNGLFIQQFKEDLDRRKLWLENKFYKLIDKLNTDNSGKITELHNQLKELDNKYNGLVELYVSPLQDKKRIMEMMQQTENEKTKLTNEISILSRGNIPILDKIKEQLELIEETNKIEIRPYYSREEIINLRFNFIYVQPDGRLTNKFNLPMRNIKEISSKLSSKKWSDEQKQQLNQKYQQCLKLQGECHQ